jgi:hypothetical protein
MEECDGLDIKAETDNLSNQEQFRIRIINSKMQKIWLKEEVKAKQRSRGRDVTNEIGIRHISMPEQTKNGENL